MRLVILLTLLITASKAEQFGRGWWHGRQVTYKIRNGLAIYKGDIMLGRADQIPVEAESGKPVDPGFGTRETSQVAWG